MFILPVIDLLNGVVVRGVAGRRESYRPIRSEICPSADPLDVARAFRDQFGLNRLYVADLDAILHQRPNFDTYRRLAEAGFRLLVDAGVRDLESAQSILDAGAESIIAGLESVPSPQFLRHLVRTFTPQRVVFSLDLKEGHPLIGGEAWQDLTPLKIGEIALEQGIERLIVLDLAQVGVAAGISTVELCGHIRTLAPGVELITGGGVRDANDLNFLANLRIDGVLIASALHDGRLDRRQIDHFAPNPLVPTNAHS